MKSNKQSLFSVFSGTLTSFTVWLAILVSINPYKSDIITKAAFFASLFLWLTGIISFIIVYLGSLIKQIDSDRLITSAIIQGSIISAVAVLMIILKTLAVLDLWEISLIIIIFALSEIYFLMINNKKYEQTDN